VDDPAPGPQSLSFDNSDDLDGYEHALRSLADSVPDRTFSASVISLWVRPSPILVLVFVLVAGVLALALTIPVVSGVFGFATLPAGSYLMSAIAVIVSFALMNVAKLIVARDARKPA